MCRLMLFIKFRKFSVIVSTDTFSSISPCPLHLGLSLYVCGMFDVVPHVSGTLNFSTFFFLFLVQIEQFLFLYIQIHLIISFALLNLLLNPSSELFISAIKLFNSRMFIWSF